MQSLSLTLVRILPGGRGARPERDFAATRSASWGGSVRRGLASVVFTLIAVEALHDAGPVADTIAEIATWTILLSVVAHGLSAAPFARAYGHRIEAAGDIPELAKAPEPRVRRRSLT